VEQIDIAQKQLDQFYSSISDGRKIINDVRKWALTVWLAIVIAFASDKIPIESNPTLFALIVSIIFFWLLEGLQFASIRIDQLKAAKLEEFIANYSESDVVPLNYYYRSSYDSFTYTDKIKLLIKALFLSSMLVVFYLALASLSFLFIYLF